MLRKHLLLLLIFFHPVTVTAELQVGSYFIPGLVEDENSGLFIKLHQKIFAEIGTPYQLQLQATQQAQLSFITKKTAALFPELEEGLARYPNPESFIRSAAFWRKRIYLYSLKEQVYEDLDELQGQAIGAVKGFSYGSEISNDPNIQLRYQHNDLMNIKLLLAGKLAAVIGDDASTLNAVQEANGLDRIHVDLAYPIVSLDVFYVCHNIPKGHELCTRISNAINELEQRGLITINPMTSESHIKLP